ncbi:hypothetical protein [Palleronia sp.]|uniref:hypothetical protein n=1 Tax=Palleronia sp. TaxID=1940284 RepID=UPI0035C822D4
MATSTLIADLSNVLNKHSSEGATVCDLTSALAYVLIWTNYIAADDLDGAAEHVSEHLQHVYETLGENGDRPEPGYRLMVQ